MKRKFVLFYRNYYLPICFLCSTSLMYKLVTLTYTQLITPAHGFYTKEQILTACYSNSRILTRDLKASDLSACSTNNLHTISTNTHVLHPCLHALIPHGHTLDLIYSPTLSNRHTLLKTHAPALTQS